MKLSVCLLAKNEEDNLARAVRSFERVADQVIVTDTGSTDGTVELAQQLGAEVSHFPWCDDFAVARNFCFAQAMGEWIFWIDADEELLPESVDELNRCTSRHDVFAYLVLRQDLTDLSRPDSYSEMWQPRLFRNHKDINLVGRNHSQFQPSLSELAAREEQVVETCEIRIRHDGYAGPRKKDKILRAVRLLQLELQDRPGQLYYQVELYRSFLLVGDERWRSALTEATENLRQYFDDQAPPSPQAALLLETLLQLPDRQLPSGISRAHLRDLAKRWFPRSAPLLWVLAKSDYEQNRFREAEFRLRRLIEMGKDHSYDRMVGFDPHILGEEAQLNLAVCLIRRAKLDEAVRILRPLVSSEGCGEAAEKNLKAIRRIRSSQPGRGRRRRRR